MEPKDLYDAKCLRRAMRVRFLSRTFGMLNLGPRKNPNPRKQFRIDRGIQYEVSLVEFSSCSTPHQL